MAKSIEKLTSDVSAINSAVKGIDIRTNDFLKEQAYGVVSTEISNVDGSGNPLAIGVIQLGDDMKGKMLKFSKVVLTFPDGSNPLIIPNDYGNQPGTGTENQFVVKVGSIGSEVFPETVYPVGSLILGLDYEANTVLGATGASDTTGDDVQYYFGGALAASSNTNTQGGSPHDFKFNRVSGVVTAQGFAGDGSALTNLPATSPGGANNQVQFAYNGAFTADSDFSFNQFSNILDVSTVRAENATAGIYLSAGSQYMYLTPVDFIATASSSSNGFISNDGARLGIISGQTYYAQFQVPKGYKVNYVDLKGSANYSFYIYASSYSSGTQVYKATGTINTPLTLLSYQQLIGSAGDYFTLKVTPSGYGNYIYGCQIGLIKT